MLLCGRIPEGFCIFPVVDVSLSMTGTPMKGAIMLGLLVAYAQKEHLIMTFSTQPCVYRLPKLFGEYKVGDVIKSMQCKEAGLSTDFNLSMRLMLKELVRRKAECPPEEEGGCGALTPVLVVGTDMQFDHADGGGGYGSNLDAMEREYAAAGICMPLLVLWNMRGLYGGAVAAQESRRNVVMLSGFNADLVEEFLGMLGSGKFKDVHVPCQEEEGATAVVDDKRPQLDTDQFVKMVLSSEMYNRCRMPQ